MKSKNYSIIEENIGIWNTVGKQSMVINPGRYKIELFGAQGGDGSWNSPKRGGYGGHTIGVINITKKVEAYIYVGGKGVIGGKGGFNGGGDAFSSSDRRGGSGGGASDFRVIEDNLYNRILVAGGGGGAEYDTKGDLVDSSGGGLTGGCGHGDRYDDKCGAIGGSQNSGGKGENNGTFGLGGSVPTSEGDRGGGGGGWYGGGSGYNDGDGGGGSGYALTLTSAKPSGYFSEWKKFIFDEVEMESGVREGDGQVIITRIGDVPIEQDDKFYCSFVFPYSFFDFAKICILLLT